MAIDYAQCEADCDCGIDGVTSTFQDIHTDLSRERVRR